MKRLWILAAQAAMAGVVVFVLAALIAPESLPWRARAVEGTGAIAVALGEGKPAPAKVIGTDPETDLAVLKIEARDLRTIALGDFGALQIGDVVLAIGNPFGVGQTVTQGVISASGGALVDAAGRLIGINSAILSPSGGSLGIGLAIPVRTATEVMTQLIKDGRVARGWSGVEAQDLTPELARDRRACGSGAGHHAPAARRAG